MKKYILLIFIFTVINCCLGGQFFGNISSDLKNLKPTSKVFSYNLVLENINDYYFSYLNFNENFTYTGYHLGLTFKNFKPWMIVDSKKCKLSKYIIIIIQDLFISYIKIFKFIYSIYVDFNTTVYSVRDAYYDIKEKVYVFSKTLPLQVFRLEVLKNTTEMFNIEGVYISQNLNSYVSSYKNQFVFLGKNEADPVMMLYLFNTNTKSLELLFQTNKKVKYSSINLVRGLNPRFVYFSNLNTNAEGYLFDLETKTIESFNTTKKNRNQDGVVTSLVANEFLTSIVPNFRYVPIAYDSSYYKETISTALSVNSFNLSLVFILLLTSLILLI
ncbi:hypothetical protein DICPUDRAFT_154224 [Dictyostelium purpureum]|uniref:Uncharacterized protein n=1 Tax=Dictyostelium purpureum TaxID=5786 RepID=F0ZQS6_DICPU|nr:uncharacterized protein DICPUDRAFT_154224 [Dictyostelium purpureum]EGC33691.1 hypothetical protein DICPUDRAFT_154224 [Dictyostelium purpureum]|eukprot:XP_003289768.1 hypothetical protein DICPUDRAFT_154224 [Dictyostelium purpureum]